MPQRHLTTKDSVLMSILNRCLIGFSIFVASVSLGEAGEIRVEFGGTLYGSDYPKRFSGSLSYDPSQYTHIDGGQYDPSPTSPAYWLTGNPLLSFSVDGQVVYSTTANLTFLYSRPEGYTPPGLMQTDLYFNSDGPNGLSEFLHFVSDDISILPSEVRPDHFDFSSFTKGDFQIQDSVGTLYAGNIDTVRVVPEPSVAVILLVGALWRLRCDARR